MKTLALPFLSLLIVLSGYWTPVIGQSKSEDPVELSHEANEDQSVLFGRWVCYEPTYAIVQSDEQTQNDFEELEETDFAQTPLVFNLKAGHHCEFGTSDQLESQAWFYQDGRIQLWDTRTNDDAFNLSELQQMTPSIDMQVLDLDGNRMQTTFRFRGLVVELILERIT